MSRLSVSAILLLASFFCTCDSRTLNGPNIARSARSGTKNFGFFPTFAATRSQAPSITRVGRSAGPDSKTTESDALNVDDFIARNGLDFGKGDETDLKDADVLPQKQRTKRADDDPSPAANDLSWLLEQDAWEKVDDADLDWENVAAEEFDVEKALSREARDVQSTGNGVEDENIEDAIDAKLKELTEDLKQIGRRVKGIRLSPGEDTAEGAADQKDYNEVDDEHYLNPALWRRKRSADNEVVDIKGRIDMEFKSKPDNPTATVIIQKDSKTPETPTLSPPIYFCGTKTDPNNPEIEVSETVAAPPSAYKKIIASVKSAN